MTNLVLGGGGGEAAAYTIDQSLRFNLGDSASLSRTPGSDGNRKTWTFSFWYKCVDPSFPGDRDILSDSQAGSPTDEHWFRFGIRGTNNQLLLFPGYNYNIYATDAFFRDVGAWYHIVLRVDTTQASFDDRLRIYVNNELKAITNVSSGPSGEPPQDWVTGINSTDKQELMVYSYGTDVFVPGYLAEVYMIDGLSLAPSSFAETDEDTNQWKPIDASGLTFGTNGFYQKYGSTGGHTSFTTPGANTWTCPEGVTEVQLLVVAGGGGGGGNNANNAGGAGGGGLLEDASYTVVPGTVYDITVGAGGSGGDTSNVNGVNGSDSVWNVNAEGSGATQTAVGGGGGGTLRASDNGAGSDGGSGGGGGHYGSGGAGGSATQGDSGGGTGYGYAGGSGFTGGGTNDQGGGGGGAGAVGANGASSDAGDGGAGRANTITGASVTYAGGGGGGSRSVAGGPGGSGGGGAGGANSANGTDGTANTGGGGGGAGDGSTTGGDGGSGIVIVKPAAGYGFGLDSSGEGNNFTATNLVATDQMKDSPTNNFCTWNPLDNDGESQVLSEGNLKGTTDGYSGTGSSFILPASGKWYAEFNPTSLSAANGLFFGIADPAVMFTVTKMYDSPVYCAVYRNDGLLIHYNGTNTSTDINTFVAGDIISIAVDVDADEIWIGKNNVWQGASSPNPSTGTSGHDLTTAAGVSYTVIFGSGDTSNEVGIVNFGQDSSFSGTKTAQGNGGAGFDFYYEPPTDFLALCTSNLPDPEIKLPGEHFNTILYSGNSSTQSLTGAGLSPNFTWIKSRNTTDSHELFDVVRGPLQHLESNDTGAEATLAASLTSFDSDGFSLGSAGQVNATSSNYASWNWLSGGTPTATNVATTGVMTSGSVFQDGVSNTSFTPADGTYPDKISANTTNGFSIVNGPTSGSATQFAHGLSQAPELIIAKSMDKTDYWPVGSTVFASGWTKYAVFNSAGAVGTGAGIWNDTAPTADVFTIGTENAFNNAGQNTIFYCFHSVEGYSKVGGYDGNNVTDNAFVYTGFRPAFILIKCLPSATTPWAMFDYLREGYNVDNDELKADDTAVESTTDFIDIVSNGFKVRTAHSDVGSGSEAYMYYAVAQYPFKYANAR